MIEVVIKVAKYEIWVIVKGAGPSARSCQDPFICFMLVTTLTGTRNTIDVCNCYK